MALTGTHLVRVLRSGLQSAKHFWPRTKDRMMVPRNALKLKWWGERHASTATVMDVSFESIKALQGKSIYELRVDDEIGGLRNIRIVFLEPASIWKPIIVYPLPVIWVLEALPKKRQEWTTFDIDRFLGKRAIVKERFYT